MRTSPPRPGRATAISTALGVIVAMLASAHGAGALKIVSPGNCWPAGQTAHFSAVGIEHLPAAPIIWDSGAGSGAPGQALAHTYAAPGLYWVGAFAQGPAAPAGDRLPIFITDANTPPRQGCAIFRLAGVRVAGPAAGGRTRVRARVVLPSGAGAEGRPVGLRDPAGRVVARAVSGPDGRVEFARAMGEPGRWRLRLLEDGPSTRFNGPEVALDRRPRLSVVPPRRPVGPGADLVVTGALTPPSVGKLIQLEFRSEGAWRPVLQAHSGARGRFLLRYRFLRSGARYTVLMRVAAPRDRGWPYPKVASRPFRVDVTG